MKKENEFFEIVFHIKNESEYDNVFIENIFKKINNERKNILEILNINSSRKIKINLYDDKGYFLENIKKFYKEQKVPSYCKGTIQEGKIYFLVNNELNENTYKYELELRKIIHEYIHILYNEYICKSNERITWLDEGIALNLSKEKGKFIIEKFPILNSNIENIDLNELRHENGTFVTEKINGYDISYLTVKYLIEILTRDEFNRLIRDNNEIIKLRKKNMARCKKILYYVMLEYINTNI